MNGFRILLLTSVVFLTMSTASPRTAAAGEKYALVVGVENYIPDQLPALDYAEDDALALAATLEKLGFSVIAMTSENRNPIQKPTTADNVLDQVSRRLADRQPDDTVVLALSGHGVQFKGEPEIWFCPEQATLAKRDTLVPMSRVIAEIGRCQAGRKLLLVDACREEIAPVAAAKGVAIELDPAAPARAAPPAGTVAVFSCRPREKSFEIGDLKHSVFTHHVIEYLSGSAPPDRYPGGELGVLELASYVSSRTRETVDKRLGRSQTPEWIAPEGGFSQWPLGKRGAASGDEFPKTNALGMTFVRIGADTFEMGSNDHPDEQPLHTVKITKPFLMGQTEVTQGQFKQVMGTTPWRGRSHVLEGDNVAASYVSWDDAVEFCRRLTASERQAGGNALGRGYRLPTEAEWEYACRAGTNTRFSFGDDDRELSKYAWWGGLEGKGTAAGSPHPHEVRSKTPNAWDLYDMHGNVNEWCSDAFAPYPRIAGVTVDPRGPAAGVIRINRGGSWRKGASTCTSSARWNRTQSESDEYLGFRVVCDIE